MKVVVIAWAVAALACSGPVHPAGKSAKPRVGMVSGTVTAVGANGLVMKIACAGAAARTKVVGEMARYRLRVPLGYHAVTVQLRGYLGLPQFVLVTEFAPRATCDLVLTNYARRTDLAASPERMPTDGKSQATVTATAASKDGKPLPGERVTWRADSDAIVSSEAATDERGQARLVLRASASPTTTTVCATIGGVTGRCFVESAEASAPGMLIVTPRDGQVVRGDVGIRTVASRPAGTESHLTWLSIALDGVELSSWPGYPFTPYWRTQHLPNGVHTLTGKCQDSQGRMGCSNTVRVRVQNEISEFRMTQTLTVGERQHITARLAAACNWKASILDPDEKEVWHLVSSGNFVDATWPVAAEPGFYHVRISILPSGPLCEGMFAVNAVLGPNSRKPSPN